MTKNLNGRLIGFTGKAGVGKTTTAEWFVRNNNAVMLSFAEPLKECLSVLTGLPIDYFKDAKLKEEIMPGLNVSPREFMQKMATDFIREQIDPDFWLWRMRQSLTANEGKFIVIDDIRFDNEANLIRKAGGVIVHLLRKVPETDKHEHKSEIPIRMWSSDYTTGGRPNASLTAEYIWGIIQQVESRNGIA